MINIEVEQRWPAKVLRGGGGLHNGLVPKQTFLQGNIECLCHVCVCSSMLRLAISQATGCQTNSNGSQGKTRGVIRAEVTTSALPHNFRYSCSFSYTSTCLLGVISLN